MSWPGAITVCVFFVCITIIAVILIIMGMG